MTQLLKWDDNGVCTNPPAGWEATTDCEDTTDGYQYVAIENGRAYYSRQSYHTEQGAQLACEAALLRLGVVPLPEWGGAPSGCLVPRPDDRTQYLVVGDAWARLVQSSGAWEWKAEAGADYAKGAQVYEHQARSRAESVLRVLLAEQLEAEVARMEARP